MSGTLFIVSVPKAEKEKSMRYKTDKSPTLFNKKTASEPIVVEQGIFSEKSEAVCLDIDHFGGSNDDFRTSPLTIQKTKSCDDISRDANLLSVDEMKSKSRKSLDESKLKSSEKLKKKFRDNHALQLNILPDSTMELVLNKVLEKFRIENVTWNRTSEMCSATFTLPNGGQHDQILKVFKFWGIGERPGSSISMLPCTVIMPTKSFEKDADEVFADELSAKDQGLWDGFMNSVNARMNVAKIVDELRQDAALTFDFVFLIVIAGIMAAFGLIENSIICLTSSMLISPLMGPLIAATFSTVIKDKQLMKFGVINGLIGLFLATLVGFLFGLIVGSFDARYGVGDGLGQEILSRCEVHSLVIGAFTAIPSGAAVAIAILGENIASLVGVAISASLLPPAVNAGLLWALALLFMVHRGDENIYNSVIKSTIYSENQAVELFILGSISMAVTIINVICIYGTGILFLKIKEVAPMVSKSQQQFWQHDVKVARDYNKTLGTNEGISLKEKLLEDLAKIHGNEFRTLAGDEGVGRFTNQHTWSPMMNVTRTSRISIKDLEKLYCNPTYSKTENRPTKRLNRVGAIGKSLSPPKYQPLKNDVGNEFQFPNALRNAYMPSSSSSSSQSSCQQRNCISKDSSDTVRETVVVTPLTSRAAGEVQSKSKFIVTRAVDPLHNNQKL